MNKPELEHLDTEFYIDRAYELRRQYVALATRNFFSRIKHLFKVSLRPVSLRGTPAH